LEKEGKPISFRFYDPTTGKLKKELTKEGKTFYSKDGETPVVNVKYNEIGAPISLNKPDGTKVDLKNDVYDRDIAKVREVYPEISAGEFIALLATWLDTDEKLEDFVKNKMAYVPDSPTNNRFDVGAREEIGEYWQFPMETINRQVYGQYLGDCDDYAFLIKTILVLQGKEAKAIGLPSHALAVWIERPEGKVIARSLDTDGVIEKFEANNAKDALNGLLNNYIPEPYLPEFDHVWKLFDLYTEDAKVTTRNLTYRWAMNEGYFRELELDPTRSNHKSYSSTVLKQEPIPGVPVEKMFPPQ
jgi:hypothetical protein